MLLNNRVISLLYSLVILLTFSCGSNKKPSGFAMQNEIYSTFSNLDSVNKVPYISDTRPVDSADASKIIFDIFRQETKNYPDTIKIYARVYDSLGYFITNMANPYNSSNHKYFSSIQEKVGKIYKPRSIDVPEFTVREFGKGDSIPYQIVLNLDYSGSMVNVKDAMSEAVNQFVNLKFEYDNIAIATFNREYDIKVKMTKNKREILELYNAKKDIGFKAKSAMGEAVWNSIDLFDNKDSVAPKVLVVFSDGDDNASKKRIGDIIKKAQDNNVTIFTIAFGYSIDEHLYYMAKYTGGKFYKAKSKEELEKIFKEIYLSLRNFYLIKYKPPVFWGLHQFFLSLNFPKRDSNLIARGEYDTSELFDFDDLEKVFTRPILFEFNKFNVLPASYQILDEITDAMMSKPTIRLEIQGHTDNVGTTEINQTLSENRAKAVEEELIKRGIEPARLRFRGFGFSQPIESNLTEEGRAKNRRTAFKLISK